MSRVSVTKAVDPNRMRPDDRPVHDWYRFVLSYPPHLVRDYLERLGVGTSDTVLDPFCGTGTTLVECKKQGVASVGLERNPMAHFASSVKVDWSVDLERLAEYSDAVAQSAKATLIDEGVEDWTDLPLLTGNGPGPASIRTLEPSRFKLLLKNSISPVPLHKTLVTLDAVDRLGDPQMRAYGRLALATGLVRAIGNLRFGPEVGVGRIKSDASVVDIWHANMKTIITDIRALPNGPAATAGVLRADARDAEKVLPPQSIDAVITSPPYPNEKDYTRTTRLESVILGFIRSGTPRTCEPSSATWFGRIPEACTSSTTTSRSRHTLRSEQSRTKSSDAESPSGRHRDSSGCTLVWSNSISAAWRGISRRCEPYCGPARSSPTWWETRLPT